ncbi:SUMF1/EgtB/PvdO family nonheme iron enzyme [bacterium]|nr:SUMF1/EgtB/PvdO family nonheme iron enzyme [bacterium]
MKKNLFVLFVVLIFMIISCGENSKPVEYSVDGFIQKGPFIKDSEIQISELDENFEMIPATSFTTKTIDDLGNFKIKKTFSSRYIEIKADGYYYNEVTGSISTGTITNYVFVDLKSSNSKVNINILTTIARKRIQYLMQNSKKTYAEAKTHAEKEIVEMFGIFSEDISAFQEMDILKAGSGNATLLAISARLQGDRNPGELSALVAGIIYDIEEDGVLDDADLKTKISEGGKYISDKLATIRTGLEDHFKSSTSVKISAFEDYCDDDGDGIINKWDFDLDFKEITYALISTEYTSEEKTIRVNPENSTALAKTDEGTIVLNGTDSGLKELAVENGDSIAIKLISPDEYQKSITANVVVEITFSDQKMKNWSIESVFKITNADLAFVPAGTTSPDNGNITVEDDYYVSIYEVTFDEFDRFALETGMDLIDDWGWGRGKKPVRRLSWFDAVKYANWLSEVSGLTKVYDETCYTNYPNCIMDTDKNGYRLPSVVEWQYAARGGKDGDVTKYSGSNNIDEVAWYSGNSGDPIRSQDVGTKAPNELGIYDMSGNVSEFTSDSSLSGSTVYLIYQGCSYDLDYPLELDSQEDLRMNLNEKFDTIGFRLVRTK